MALIAVAGWRYRMQAGQFDSFAWQEADAYSEDNARMAMVKNLMERHLKNGMSRAEVATMLGTADDEFEGSWFYRLERKKDGPVGATIEYDISLVVSFDESARVSNAQVIDPSPSLVRKIRPKNSAIPLE